MNETFYYQNKADLNQRYKFPLNFYDSANFQLNHVESAPERSFAVLIRFKEVEKISETKVRVKQLEFTVVHIFNAENPNAKFCVDFSGNPAVSFYDNTDDEDFHDTENMINLRLNVVSTENLPSPIPVYNFQESFEFQTNQVFHLSVFVDEETPIGDHLCIGTKVCQGQGGGGQGVGTGG